MQRPELGDSGQLDEKRPSLTLGGHSGRSCLTPFSFFYGGPTEANPRMEEPDAGSAEKTDPSRTQLVKSSAASELAKEEPDVGPLNVAAKRRQRVA
jgi:hypothetical protein